MTGAIPPETTPPETVAFCLEVPDSAEWFGLVTGALLKLSYGYYWDKTYENWEEARDTGSVIVHSWLNRERCGDSFCSGIIAAASASDGTVNGFLAQIIEQALELCSAELSAAVEEAIGALIPSFAVRDNPEEPCILEFSSDGGETWVQFANVSTCGAQGIQGIQGEPGTQGEPGEQGIQGEQGEQGIQGEPGQSGTTSNDPGNPPGEDSEEKRCAVATGVASWMIDKFGDSLDAFAAAYEGLESIEVAVSGMIDAIPVVGAFIDAAMDFGAEIVEWDIANLKACVTEEFEDAVFCALYCELGEDGVITDTIFTNWVLGVASQPLCAIGLTLVGQVMSLMMLAVGAQNARNRAYIFASASNCRTACEDCPIENCDTVLVEGTRYVQDSGQTRVKSGCNWTCTSTTQPSSGLQLLQIKSDDGSYFSVEIVSGFDNNYSEWHSESSGTIINDGIPGCGNELILGWPDNTPRTIVFTLTDCD